MVSIQQLWIWRRFFREQTLAQRDTPVEAEQNIFFLNIFRFLIRLIYLCTFTITEISATEFFKTQACMLLGSPFGLSDLRHFAKSSSQYLKWIIAIFESAYHVGFVFIWVVIHFNLNFSIQEKTTGSIIWISWTFIICILREPKFKLLLRDAFSILHCGF